MLKHLSANGIKDLKELDLSEFFGYPKQVSLIKELVSGMTLFTGKNEDIILDFFSEKHIQPYVFTDGTANKSVERKFAEDLDGADEVSVYAKLPKGFSIPTPVGNYKCGFPVANNGMITIDFSFSGAIMDLTGNRTACCSQAAPVDRYKK